MKKLVLLLLLTSVSFAQNYKKIKIFPNSRTEIAELAKLGIPIDDAYFDKQDKSLSLFVSDDEFLKIKNKNVNYEVLIDNWREYYKNREKTNAVQLDEQVRKSRDLYNVKGFDYGSMGGFLTYQEIQEHLDSMHVKYPDIITAKWSIGHSVEGRDIFAVKISDNPDVDEDEPEVLYDATIHAREPQAMMTVMYFMYYLLENYGTDPQVTYLVDNREMYFIPLLNPDGYEYNRSTDPNGGGMWRKNRRINDDGSIGVDLNRNFGYKWGYDDNGSSPVPSSGTYRGSAPFSEPETEALRQFCIAHNFKNALNYHTYSNLLILPWGYIPEETPDSLIYRQFGRDMTKDNHYTWGISSDIIYEVNGDSDDWMYGEQTEKNKILSMTPEVGSGSDGFWPSRNRIYPLAMENVSMNLYLAWAAGEFVGTERIILSRTVFNPGDRFLITPFIKNKGLSTAKNIIVHVENVTDKITPPFAMVDIDSLTSQEVDTLVNAFSLIVANDAPIGEMQKFAVVAKSNGVVMSRDTFGVYVGTPQSIFFDACDAISDNWTARGKGNNIWRETDVDFYSAPSSFTESEQGNYSSDADIVLESKEGISLSEVNSPNLGFWTKFDIESGWDYGQVLISSDNGRTWKPVGGKFAKPGSGSFQPNGEPVYDGQSDGWQYEVIDLSEFAGKNIKIKFELKSDSYVEGDGWFLDDINVFYYTLVGVNDDAADLDYNIEQNYPNPFNPTTTIAYTIKETGLVTIKLYDILGRELKTLLKETKAPGKYKLDVNGSDLSSGMYIYKINVNGFSAGKKMMLVK